MKERVLGTEHVSPAMVNSRRRILLGNTDEILGRAQTWGAQIEDFPASGKTGNRQALNVQGDVLCSRDCRFGVRW
ncbi:hypothetical protein Q31a_58950 [Aureliella helgolandensis]|uniref:Uncharacterized protein n=1 Tax=Aureliella helgolandensis TaxID=2527968 RepID=A0A518GFX4_9BACT|nr:hypothetical protein Q31a_58950 [Aureliella helgolandensis]